MPPANMPPVMQLSDDCERCKKRTTHEVRLGIWTCASCKLAKDKRY